MFSAKQKKEGEGEEEEEEIPHSGSSSLPTPSYDELIWELMETTSYSDRDISFFQVTLYVAELAKGSHLKAQETGF